MKKRSALLQLASACVASFWLLAAPPAAARLITSYLCESSTVTIGNPGYLYCDGTNFPGVIGGSASNLAFVKAAFVDFFQGNWTFAGKSNDANAGPFAANPGAVTTGRLTLDSPVPGLFVIVLQATDGTDPLNYNYSAYLFNGASYGSSAPSLNFNTFALSTANSTRSPALSFAALFLPVAAAAVAEPGGAALVLAGLVVLALTRRRR